MNNAKRSDQPSKPETVVFTGQIGEVVHTEQPDGRVFEQFRRAPGVRLVIISPEGKILITKEHRHEISSTDLRLPGGKVCDTIEDYRALLNSGADVLAAAKQAAIKEALEETGLVVRDPKLIVKANAGATVDWDLYYFEVRDYDQSPDGQQLESGEAIEVDWMNPGEIRQAIAGDQMAEWRSVGVLLGRVLPELVGD